MTEQDVTRDERAAELAANLAHVRRRLATACEEAGRHWREVTLVAITKTFPATDVRRLATLGVTDIGENRDQEIRAKLPDLTDVPVRWHFVGRLQRNKARSVAGYADLVHSVDRTELVAALDTAAQKERQEPLGVLLQLSLDADTKRGGVTDADLLALADRVAAAEHLRLRGLMAVAPLDADADAAFARLAAASQRLRAQHPEATAVSAGMSGDLEAAIRNGATHVRVGTALLGGREKLVR